MSLPRPFQLDLQMICVAFFSTTNQQQFLILKSPLYSSDEFMINLSVYFNTYLYTIMILNFKISTFSYYKHRQWLVKLTCLQKALILNWKYGFEVNLKHDPLFFTLLKDIKNLRTKVMKYKLITLLKPVQAALN